MFLTLQGRPRAPQLSWHGGCDRDAARDPLHQQPGRQEPEAAGELPAALPPAGKTRCTVRDGPELGCVLLQGLSSLPSQGGGAVVAEPVPPHRRGCGCGEPPASARVPTAARVMCTGEGMSECSQTPECCHVCACAAAVVMLDMIPTPCMCPVPSALLRSRSGSLLARGRACMRRVERG